jgi:hypothetical protein
MLPRRGCPRGCASYRSRRECKNFRCRWPGRA